MLSTTASTSPDITIDATDLADQIATWIIIRQFDRIKTREDFILQMSFHTL